MSNCCVLEFKLIDDTTNIEVNLEDNTQDIKINLTDYNDSAIKKEIADLTEEINNKVDKVTGKGLSTNDYTDLEKEKLASLENYDDTEIKEDIANLEENKANRSEIPDVSEFITKDVNNLTHYELKTNTGTSIVLSIDNNTYVMTLSLKNSAGNILNTQTVDLPLETMVVGGSYDNVNKKIILTLKNGNTIDVPVSDLISGLQSEITPSNKLSSDLVDDTNKTNKFVTNQEKETWNNKGTYSKPSEGIPKIDLSNDVQKSLNIADDVKNSKFIVKEYSSYNDFPAIKISYRYTTSFDYTWGPPEEYYTYQNGKWVTDVSGVYLDISNPPFNYTYEDLQNVTCEITSQLPTDVYPDITINSFELSYADGYVTPDYISASYYPVLNTSYGDSQHNPYTNNISFSFDIIFPEKFNTEISSNALYKAVDTGKLYIPNFTTLEWEEYTGSYLDGTPLMNIIDKAKQDKLNSGENIKTINGDSLLESGNLSLATASSLSNYLQKSYVINSRSTSTSGYTYDVRYINNMIKTSRTTTNYNVYDCKYINALIKTSRTTSSNYTYDCNYVNSLIKTANTSSNNATYSCNYIDNNFLTLETLPRWDGGNQ